MYSPQIDERHIHDLWKLKSLNEVLTGQRKPMTQMVNEAVEEYLKKENKKVNLLLRDKDMSTVSLQLMELSDKGNT